jgi:hypothetical protein
MKIQLKMNYQNFLFSILIFLISINCYSQINNQNQKMNTHKLRYLDGSGNAYNITSDSISYNPISPEISSSGIYSGGKEVHKAIQEKDFVSLNLLFDNIFSNKKIQIGERIKTSGVLIRYDLNNVMEQIIISKSDEQNHLEDFLKKLLEN